MALGVQDKDSGTSGTGGILGTDGAGTGGGLHDAAVGSGGAQGGQGGFGSGGTVAQDAPMATGGVTQPGGQVGLGGGIATGGAMAAGGAVGTGGTGKICSGSANTACPAGQFCDLDSNCGAISTTTGTCVATGMGLGCPTDYTPVCGCNRTTYSNDCMRKVAGVLKASAGACPTPVDAGATACAGAYLAWMAPGGFAGTGPAVAVCGRGWADTWTNISSFQAETPPSSATGNYTVSITQSDDLFARLAAVDLASLPHPTTGGAECYPSLYLRTCATCAAKTLTYSVAAQLLPEMEQVWLWFDQLLGATATTNPRNYCRL